MVSKEQAAQIQAQEIARQLAPDKRCPGCQVQIVKLGKLCPACGIRVE